MTEFEKSNQPPAYEKEQPSENPAESWPQPNQNNMVYQQPQLQQPQQNTQMSQTGTTVIINQPAPNPSRQFPRPWTSGICSGMCDDVRICLCGFFCGGCLAGSVATDMGESSCVPCCVPGAEITLRVKWRTQENIQGSIMDDCLTVWCCGPCAMCQLAREVKAKRTGTCANW